MKNPDLAWKVVSVAEMQAVEREADASGLSYVAMMENAGQNLAEVVHSREGKRAGARSILALVGPGNNGGDALVALDYLARWGWQVSAYFMRPRPHDPLVARVLAAGGEVALFTEDLNQEFLRRKVAQARVVLDGVLGTGTRLPLREEPSRLLVQVGALIAQLENPPHIVAVDCPSGVDCDSGNCAPETLTCELTVTMAALKQGLVLFPAAEKTGELLLVGIGELGGLDAWAKIQTKVIDAAWVRRTLPGRPVNAHKGTFGTAIICAGSLSYSGAALLAGKAAHRSGTGLVTLAVPEPLHAALAGHFPEATWILLPSDQGFLTANGAQQLLRNLDRAQALLLGPGWGLQPGTREFLASLLNQALPPLVMDADALKLLATIPGWPALLAEPAVLTPHPGEMAVLTGEPKEAQANRLTYAREYARKWGQVVVLKGAYTIVASPNGEIGVIPFATPALARAGSGDVLAGLITGLRAQGLDAFEAACCGAWIHGRAGMLAAQNAGGNTASVLAGDILAAVRQAFPGG